MTRIVIAVVVALLLTNSSFAQSYCDQVRQAVATYGYAAAKRHAMAAYSKREVEVADRCVRGGHRPGSVRNVVEIRSGIISEKLIISYYAARSNC